MKKTLSAVWKRYEKNLRSNEMSKAMKSYNICTPLFFSLWCCCWAVYVFAVFFIADWIEKKWERARELCSQIFKKKYFCFSELWERTKLLTTRMSFCDFAENVEDAIDVYKSRKILRLGIPCEEYHVPYSLSLSLSLVHQRCLYGFRFSAVVVAAQS